MALTGLNIMYQKLMTKAIRKQAKPIGSTDSQKTKPVLVKYFTPWANWTWYAVEFDGDDTFFGYVESGIDPDFSEWGYFTLSELEGVEGPVGLKVERDLHFDKKLINFEGAISNK